MKAIWYESTVLVISGVGYSQNAGILVALIRLSLGPEYSKIKFDLVWLPNCVVKEVQLFFLLLQMQQRHRRYWQLWSCDIQKLGKKTAPRALGFPGYSGWGGRGSEVSCGGHHWQRGKTTTGSALDGAVLDFTQILAYLVHNMSRSQLYLGFGQFGWLLSFFGQ